MRCEAPTFAMASADGAARAGLVWLGVPCGWVVNPGSHWGDNRPPAWQCRHPIRT